MSFPYNVSNFYLKINFKEFDLSITGKWSLNCVLINSNVLFRMHELGISPQERKVFFGQLLGMSDAISFTLGM